VRWKIWLKDEAEFAIAGLWLARPGKEKRMPRRAKA
jgi:hypothetical protein